MVACSARPSGTVPSSDEPPDLTRALYRALFEEWSTTDYTSICLERVAAHARAGKAAIYRRWLSKLAFASDAIERIGFDMADFTDQGSLAGDLNAYLLATRRALRHGLVCRILPDLIAERSCSRELEPVVDRLGEARRRKGGAMLDRAVARGELPAGMDRELALDLIPAPFYWRMIVREKRARRQDIERLVRAIIAALKAC